MKIEQSTPDLLVLKDLGAPLRVSGLITLAIGSAFAFAAFRSGVPGVSFAVVAAMAVAGGIAAIILPQRVTVVFDRAAHTVRISRRSIRGSTLDEIDFNKITAVAAETPPTSRSAQQTWRVCIVLRDGARVPLTSYYISGTSQFTAAAAASTFLGLQPPPPGSGPAGAAAPPPAVKRPPSKFVLVLMTAFSLVFAVLGARLLWLEWHRLTVSLPVRAYVLSTDVVTVHSGGRNNSTSYRPDVLFSYRVAGRDYSARTVTPLNESRSGHWAFNLVAKYRAGDSVTAWYDPARPQMAFLEHEWSLLPLVFIGFPLIFLTAAWIAFKKAGVGARGTTTA